MVNLQNIADAVGPGFMIGFAEGFIIASMVCLIRMAVRLFKRILFS